MDRFIAYSSENGLMVYDNANVTLAKHQAEFDGNVFLGYERRFLQHFGAYVLWLADD